MASSLHADSSLGGTTDGGVTRDVDRTVVMGESETRHGERAPVSEGSTLGRFVVLEEIGAGAMGRVLRGYDTKLRREVALKLVRTSSEATTERLLREARAMAQLSHPNVVPIYDVGEQGTEVFIAMEYVQGVTLRDWVDDEKPQWRAIVSAFRQAGEGLAAAHRAGLIHRDFKSDNVLVPAGYDELHAAQRVRVMDFGLARALDDRPSHEIGRVSIDGSVDLVSGSFADALTQVGTVMGTPAYMAPEQHRGRGVDAKSDQYAYCVALHEALWGQRPFAGDTLQELAAAKERFELRALPADAPSVPRWVRRIVLRGLAADPSERWPSMEVLVAALGRDPSRTRLRLLGLAAVIAAAAVPAMLAGSGRELCAGASRQLTGIWDDARRAELESAILATNVAHAQHTFARTADELDDYATRWTEAHVDACEASQARGEQSQAVMDARMRCLHTRRRDLSALIEELRHADAEAVHKAVEAVHRLPAIEPCNDVTYVLAQVPPPDDPEMLARVEAIREWLARASAASAAGRFAEGLELARQAHDEALATGYAPLVPEAAFRLAVLLEDTGAYEESVQALRASFFEARRTGMDEIAAKAATMLVFMLGERLARPEEGFVWAEHARAEVARFGTERMQSSLWRQLAALHRSAGELEQAQTYFERAVAIDEKVLGVEHTQTALSLMGLAIVLAERGNFDEAQRLHERSLAINEAALGPEHPSNAQSLTNLGAVAWRRGNLDDARRMFERALALNERARGAEHPVTATSLVSLANVHAIRGELDDAERLYARARAINENALGVDHPDSTEPLLGLAIVHAHRGDYERARPLYEQAIAIREKALGANHPTLAVALSNLANVHYALENLTEARTLYARVLEIHEATHGPEHPDVARALKNLAWACWKQGELEQAATFAARAFALAETTLGPDHPEVAATAIITAEVALSSGRAADPLPALERALAAIDRRSDTPPDLAADVRFALARALWEAPAQHGRDRTRALTLAEQAQAGYRAITSPPGELEQIDTWLASRRR